MLGKGRHPGEEDGRTRGEREEYANAGAVERAAEEAEMVSPHLSIDRGAAHPSCGGGLRVHSEARRGVGGARRWCSEFAMEDMLTPLERHSRCGNKCLGNSVWGRSGKWSNRGLLAHIYGRRRFTPYSGMFCRSFLLVCSVVCVCFVLF